MLRNTPALVVGAQWVVVDRAAADPCSVFGFSSGKTARLALCGEGPFAGPYQSFSSHPYLQ